MNIRRIGLFVAPFIIVFFAYLSFAIPVHAAPLSVRTVGNTIVEFFPEESNRRVLGGFSPNDYYSLFTPNAPWQPELSKVGIFGISFEAALYSISSSSLPGIMQFLNTHQIALSVGGSIVPTKATCGLGEGYGGPTPTIMLLKELNRIKSSGGTADFLEIDEDLWYGHEARGKVNSAGTFVPGCHYTTEEIASFAAAAFEAARTVFPNIEVIDGEPVLGNEDNRLLYYNDTVDRLSGAEWVASIKTYLQEFKRITGVPIYAFYADPAWSEHYQDQLIPISQYLKGSGTKLGVYFVSSNTTSDQAWDQSAISNYQNVLTLLGIVPDISIVTSWTLQPHFLLPDTQPGTLTYLFNAITATSSSNSPVTFTQSLATTTSENQNVSSTIQPFTISWMALDATKCIVRHSNPGGALFGVASTKSGSIVERFNAIGTHHLWIDCDGNGVTTHNDLYHSVVFAPLLLPPTASITSTPAASTVGMVITVIATSSASQGDSITDTAIREIAPGSGESKVVQTGQLNHTALQNPLSYTLMPTAPGTYTFKSFTMTKAYPTLQETGSVYVNVMPQSTSFPSSRTDFYTHLYRCILGREPDVSGLASWVTNSSQWTLARVYESWFSGAEYLGHHTTNEQFVTQIYKCILFRQLDQRGYDGYVQALQNSFTTRTSVVLNAVTSQEFLSNQGPMLSSATGLPLSSKAILDTYTITPTVSCLSSPSTGNVILVHAPYVMQAQSILKIYSNASTTNTFYSKSIAGSTSMNGPAGFAPSYNPPAMPAALSIIPGNTYYVSLYDPTLNYGSIKQFNIPVCHLGISGSDIVSQLASLMVSLKAILDSLTSLGSH